MPKSRPAPSRKQLLKVSTRMFATRGFSRTTLRAIADEAGVNQGMIHYYWRTKIALYEEVYARVFEDFGRMVRESIMNTAELDLKTHEGLREMVRRIVDETFVLLERQPFIQMILARHMMGEVEGTDHLTEKYARRLFENASQIFDGFVKEGYIRPQNVRLLIAFFCFIIMGFYIGGDRYLFPGEDFIGNPASRREFATALENLLFFALRN